jgi:multicomponent Na+:H+ antiporter subunit A
MLLVALATVFGLAAVTPALTRAVGRNAGYLGAAVLGGLAVWLGSAGPAIVAGEPVISEVAWIPSGELALALRMDGLGLLFSLIVLGIGALVLAYCARYFAQGDAKASRYLSLLIFFAGAMLGLVLADDIVLLFVFWELTSVSSFFLIGGMGEGQQGATRAFITTAVGGLALLAGVVLLSLSAGTTSVSAMLADPDPIRFTQGELRELWKEAIAALGRDAALSGAVKQLHAELA